ncbi:MMPL family transporter [Paenibacillus agilis]|uniref:MMPL family transporter n=1 Tax=Paenibacillus agilis TaxID=3020863 RepID=A0A559IC54_9BACL|nr:MMPL family transporter [Paenibacillus agilis]TVX85252.1 MMPL family transporter [Paenibacillus agilis]
MEGYRGLTKWVTGKYGRWITLALWIAVVLVLSFIWPNVNSQEKNNEPSLPESAPSVQAEQMANKQFPGEDGSPALIVWKREGGIEVGDIHKLQTLTKQWQQSPLPYMEKVIPLHQLPTPAVMSQLSEDRSTLVFPVIFDEQADPDQLKEGITQLKRDVTDQFADDPFSVSLDDKEKLSARITGPVGIQIDATGLFKNADVSLLIGTVLLVVVILLLIYRSPILALIPLIAVGFAFGVTSPILGYMAQQGWITVDAQAISIMTVLLFGAGTDYCLFLISHYRQMLTIEVDKVRALVAAFRGSAGAIAMSGLTVVLALFALLLAEYGPYQRFAVPFSISIFIMGLASLTLVPAMLAILGRVSFFPFVPRTPQMQEERAKRTGKIGRAHKKQANPSDSRIGRLVVSKPWSVIVVTLLLLGGLASFSPQIKYTYDLLSSFPSNMESREGFTVIGEQFAVGNLAPVQVIYDSNGKPTSVAEALRALPFVSTVSEPQVGKENKEIIAHNIEFNINPYSVEAMEHIPAVRSIVEQALQQAGVSEVEQKVWIGGQTAAQYDTKVIGQRDTQLIIPVVIGLISLLLLVYLRSIVATIYLIATVVLSYFSALGLGWVIFHYGFGVEAIQGAIPLYAFVFLVALGEDYNIFMVSRIWQKSRYLPLKQAIREGVSETSSVITSAGIILAGTFAVLASLPIQVLVQFGTVTALGVLLDTFIVRPLLVPAITAVLGRAAFWPGLHRKVDAAQLNSSTATEQS